MPAPWKDIVANPYFLGKNDEEKLKIAQNYFSKNFDTDPMFQEKAGKDPEYRDRVWGNFVSKAIPKEKWKTSYSIDSAVVEKIGGFLSQVSDFIGGDGEPKPEAEPIVEAPKEKVEPSISAAKPEERGILSRLFRPSGELTAKDKDRAAGVMTLAEMTNLPPSFVDQNLDAVTKKLGIRGTPTTEELVGGLVTVALAAGIVTAPVATVAAVGKYAVAKEAESVMTQALSGEDPKVLQGREAKELIGTLREPLQGAVEAAEVVLPGAAAAGVKLPKLITDSNWFRKMTIKERGLVLSTAEQMKASGMTEGEIARIRPEEWKKAFKERGGSTEPAVEAVEPAVPPAPEQPVVPPEAAAAAPVVPDYAAEAAKLPKDLGEVRYVGEQMGYPMFQQEAPGVGSFMLKPGETVAQAFERAKERYDKAAVVSPPAEAPATQEAPSLSPVESVAEVEADFAKTVDDIIGDVTPQPGLSVRPVGETAAPSYTKEAYKFENEETESRYSAAHGVTKQPFSERAKVLLSSLWNKATREYEHIPRTAEFAPLRTELLKLSKQKGVSSDRAIRAMQSITIKLDPTRMGLFERKVLLDDLAYEAERGHELPFEFNKDSLQAEYGKINALADKDPLVKESLDKRQAFADSVRTTYTKAMSDIGLNVSGQFGNEKYFRHQVLEYANLRGIAGAGQKLKSPTGRGFMKRRAGSVNDINTNYLEAEHEVFAQMLHDIEVAKAIKMVDDNYNILNELKAKAKEQGLNWQDILPEGYRLWQPQQGNVFFLADSIPAKIAEKLRSGALEEIGITEEDLRSVVSVGGRRRQFLLKNEVADTLDKLVKIRPESALLNLDRQAMKGWKVWQLISPRRFLKYNFRNLTGDADATFVGNPSSFKKVPQAVRELYQVFAVEKGMTPEMREWFSRGGFETTLQAQEMSEISKFRAFKHIRSEKESLSNLPVRVFRAYWRKARLATDFRESVLRYASYLDYLEQMTVNAEMRPKNFGASIPEEIMAIKDVRDRAFTLSNQLLGAYDQISVMGTALREHIFPFWSWKEVNFRRYIQLAKNAASDDNLASMIGKKAGASGARATLRVGKFLISATAFWAMLQAWNHTRFPDEEEELDVNTRNRPHIILGRRKNGEIINFTNLGALGDFLAWFGLDSAPLHVSNWFQGKRTLKEIAEEMAKSPVNVIVQGTSPIIRQPAELLTGKSLFPDAFRPTMIRDRGYFMAKSVGLENEYAAIMKLPTEGYNKSLANFFVYASDPGKNAYNDIISEKYRFLKKIGKGGDGGFMSPKSNALYNIRLAIKLGDDDAKKKFLSEYLILGGTVKGLQLSIKNLYPLSGLTREEQAAFVSQLTSEDKRKLARAMHFYGNILVGKAKQKGEQ